MIAAGITGYDGKQEPLPPEIGTLRFYRKSWAENQGIEFDEIEIRDCLDSDFDYGPARNLDASFYQTIETAGDLVNYGNIMKCVKNPEDMYIYGNYNTGNAAAIMVVFELCDSKALALDPAT